MNKKMVVGSLSIVLLIISLSFISVAISDTTKQNESPLYKIRTKKAIGDNFRELMENIRSNYLDEKNFLIFSWLKFDEIDKISSPTAHRSCGSLCIRCIGSKNI